MVVPPLRASALTLGMLYAPSLEPRRGSDSVPALLTIAPDVPAPSREPLACGCAAILSIWRVPGDEWRAMISGGLAFELGFTQTLLHDRISGNRDRGQGGAVKVELPFRGQPFHCREHVIRASANIQRCGNKRFFPVCNSFDGVAQRDRDLRSATASGSTSWPGACYQGR